MALLWLLCCLQYGRCLYMKKNTRVRYAFILIVRFNVEIIIILVDDK